MTRRLILQLLVDVAGEFDVPIEEIRGFSRIAEYVEARQEFIRRAYHAGVSYPRIGRAIRRDPTTVIYHAKKLGLGDRPEWHERKGPQPVFKSVRV